MEKAKPITSIIIPVYKVQDVLARCLDSVCNQTYKHLEILLIDDGSPDDSGVICEEYAKNDARIKVIHKVNQGVSAARNTGIEHSTGSLILFIDSDDYIENDMVEVMVSNHSADCIVVSGYFEENIVNDRTEKLIKTYSDTEEISVIPVSEVTSLYAKFLLNPPWNKLYEAEVIRRNKIRFPADISLGEDLLFNLEYLSHKKAEIHFINEPLYHYININADSLSNRFNPKHLELQIVLNERLIDYCLNKLEIDEKNMGIVYHRYYRHLVDEFEKIYGHDESENKRASLKVIQDCLVRAEVQTVIHHEIFKKRYVERWFLKRRDYAGFRKYTGMKKTIRQSLK